MSGNNNQTSASGNGGKNAFTREASSRVQSTQVRTSVASTVLFYISRYTEWKAAMIKPESLTMFTRLRAVMILALALSLPALRLPVTRTPMLVLRAGAERSEQDASFCAPQSLRKRI